MADVDWGHEFALVAVGGYGRSELSPYSDVDLMVLHSADDPSGLAAGVFRPMWDANLKVGHSIRTVAEATAAAKERFETHTTLITSRLVAGSSAMFARLTEEVAMVTKARPLRPHLVEEERDRRRRSPYLRMAGDVKNGRGGLRTLQSFSWVGAREQMIGRYSADWTQEEAVAYDALLRIRNALHATTGRRHDIYSYDLRGSVARWLRADPFDVATQLVGAMETADRIASRRWPELAEGSRSIRFGRLGRSTGFRTDRAPAAPEFVEMLRAGDEGRLSLERLWEAGHLADVLPDWGRLIGLPQMEPFHEHPVAAHLWRTVDEMQTLIDGDDEHYRKVAVEVDSDLALTLAAFLHDIGKGQGGDHSEIGAVIARSVCERLGCSDDVVDLVERVVGQHLLLGRAAARRDIDDPAVLEDVAGAVGDLRSLQVLYLLTVADSRATGATMWSDWKATLLRTLFLRVAGRFGAGAPVPDSSSVKRELLAGIDPVLRARVEKHLDSMADEYVHEVTPEEILWHVRVAGSLDGGSSMEVEPGDTADRMLVVGRPHPVFRRVVAEALAANGVDVLQARLRSRSDGIIVDSFVVHDDRSGGSVAGVKWDRVRRDIESALAGGSEMKRKVAVRADAYSGVQRRPDLQPNVRIYEDSATGEPVMMVRCEDRIGRLAQLLAVLSDFGVEIRLAKLDSRVGEMIDTFHIHQGSIPDDATSIRILEKRIADALD